MPPGAVVVGCDAHACASAWCCVQWGPATPVAQRQVADATQKVFPNAIRQTALGAGELRTMGYVKPQVVTSALSRGRHSPRRDSAVIKKGPGLASHAHRAGGLGIAGDVDPGARPVVCVFRAPWDEHWKTATSFRYQFFLRATTANATATHADMNEDNEPPRLHRAEFGYEPEGPGRVKAVELDLRRNKRAGGGIRRRPRQYALVVGSSAHMFGPARWGSCGVHSAW